MIDATIVTAIEAIMIAYETPKATAQSAKSQTSLTRNPKMIRKPKSGKRNWPRRKRNV